MVPFSHKIENMKLLSTATLAATLLSYVAADVSKVELHQRALKAFSGRKWSHAFSRELDVSFECITNQNVLEDTGVNEPLEDDPDDDQMMDACDIKTKGDRVTAECDYDALGITMIDSDACASAGGSVAKINMEMECDMVSIIMLNVPHCIHDTCDAKELVELMEDVLAEDTMDDLWDDDMMGDLMGDCDISYELSRAAIGSTSIISIALVSLFAMLW